MLNSASVYEPAIEFVMSFYQVSREVAIQLYWDEIEAFMSLQTKLKDQQ
jgi:hypothetical protein